MLGFSSVNIIKLKWLWWLKVYRSIIKYVCCSFASLTRLIPWMQLLPLIRFSCWVLSVCWIISGFFNTSQRNWLRDRLLNVYHLISVDKWTERINLLFTFKPNSTDRMELNESTEWMNEWMGGKQIWPTNQFRNITTYAASAIKYNMPFIHNNNSTVPRIGTYDPHEVMLKCLAHWSVSVSMWSNQHAHNSKTT